MKCETHRFEPDGNGSIRSSGELWTRQCNNCLAVKVIQLWDVWTGGSYKTSHRVRHIVLTIIEDPTDQ